MKKLSLTILFSAAIYVVLTSPHFVYVQTWGKYGTEYPFWALMVCSLFSIGISKSIVKNNWY
jgi:ABC-type multidrug transport system permease subunit